MPKKVVIAGGGVAGLSAAHELSKNADFEVHLYEKSGTYGGKVKSQSPVLGGKIAKYLGEHGFRFFPWFYRHLASTLKEIPLAGSSSVYEALEESTDAAFALDGGVHSVPRGNPGVLDFLKITQTFAGPLGISVPDATRYALYLLKFHTSCHQRRFRVYDQMTWTAFAQLDGGKYDSKFAELMKSLPMVLVAMHASKGSACTLGNVNQQMLYDFDTASYSKADAVLQGPTSKIWIDPWIAALEAHPRVTLHPFHALKEIKLAPAAAAPRHVQKLVFDDLANGYEVEEDVSAGYCVCALPIERMGPILTEDLTKHSPELQLLEELVDASPWGDMIGAQYFLAADHKMLKGHAAFTETDWALTSVSQAQFWRAGSHIDPDLSVEFGVAGLDGVISVIVSDWSNSVNDSDSPVDGKTARQCTRAQATAEIWRQLVKSAFSDPAMAPVPLDSHLDENVQGHPNFDNPTPLLIHPPNTLHKRPLARLEDIDNLMLAADYVRTYTELATMEGANEAAKHAVRGIFAREGIPKPWPGVHPLEEGPLFEVARALDCWLFEMGAGNPLDLVVGSEPVASIPAVPPQLESFESAALSALPSVDPWARMPLPRRPFHEAPHFARAADPFFSLPAAGLVYEPFPRPENMPDDLDPRARRMYETFHRNLKLLGAIRDAPTELGYRLFHDLLAGRDF